MVDIAYNCHRAYILSGAHHTLYEMKRGTLILAAFSIALGALLLHMRIHPVFVLPQANGVPIPGATPEFYLPNFFASLLGIIDVILVTTLFCSRKTVALAYLLNGLFAIFGAIFMAHFAVVKLSPTHPALSDWILKSTFPDIIIAFVDFLIGKAIYESYFS